MSSEVHQPSFSQTIVVQQTHHFKCNSFGNNKWVTAHQLLVILLIIFYYNDELWVHLCSSTKQMPTKRPWESAWEINWLSLMELAFSSLFPFGPHYSPLSSLVLPSSSSPQVLQPTVRALPPPAAGSCERFSDSQTAEDWESGTAGAHHQGELRQQCHACL